MTKDENTKAIDQSDTSRKIANALNSVFYASYFGNLKDSSFKILRAKEYAKEKLKNCNDISDALECFVTELVSPLDYDKMRAFCSVETLVERLQNRSNIACEYRCNYFDGWCQAFFVPVDYDERGELVHILFVISSIDQEKVKGIEESISNKKNLEAIFDKVPGGIVLYEWDGTKLNTLNISQYYANQYGDSMLKNGSPDFQRIHPDDVEAYKKAIHIALTQTHELECVYRVWNKKLNRYLWTQINAVSELKADGNSLVYAMYSDITKQKDAELLLEKRSATLTAALNASKQLCYEYDPKLHIEECLTEDTVFHLPKIIENYPEAILDIVHPEDRGLFLYTIHLMDSGEKEASCNIRLKIEDKYVWYAYQLHSIYDYEKERIIVLLSIMDNSEHIATLKDYEERMRALLNISDASLTLGTMNVTQNTFSAVHVGDNFINIVGKCISFEDIFRNAVENVVGKKEKEEYRQKFSRQNLLKLAEQGIMSVKMEHIYRVDEKYLEWVVTCVEMLKNPQNGDVTGVCYAKSVQKEKIKDNLLKQILLTDYPLVCLIYVDSDEFYLFESAQKEYCTRKENYWNEIKDILPFYIDEGEMDELKEFTTKENVMKNLQTNNEYICTINCGYHDKKSRMEFRYYFADRVHGLIIMSMRNVTDEILLRQYKHDSEHDVLTGLFNRRTLFKNCRKLLEMHPDEQFVMLHVDIKNFHLYNTFFGEEAGDRLLCEIAGHIVDLERHYSCCAYGHIEADVFAAFFPVHKGDGDIYLHYLLDEIPKSYNDFQLELNIGVFMVQDTEMPIESMFNRATIAAKSNDVNMFGRVTQYDEKMEKTLTDNQQIMKEMHRAIEEEQFQVYLQPKYSLRTEEIVGSEALVRWIHPEKGMISPGRFIPVFESNGFIVELDHYMWEHVCMILQRWKQENQTMFPVSVNVSRVSMYSQGTVAFLKNLVLKYDIDPKYLELELTETAYMDDPEEIKIQLKELQEFGFHILMDDFGSGYSSLNTLKELPVDILKLDMKFLTESNKDLRGNIVLSSVVRMSKLLGLPIVAEGVETSQQAAYLRSIGCEYVQGYLFAKPMPVPEYEAGLPKETSIQEEKLTELKNIHKHIMVETSAVGEISPIPTGFVEYCDGKFSFLHLNQQFLREFGLDKNLKAVLQIFKEHLDEKNYNILIQAFDTTVKEKRDIQFRLYWNTNGQNIQEYSGKVHYEGKVGNLEHMVVALMNTTTYDIE